MKEKEDELWLTRIEPFEGESISHFLGRFRRAKGNRFSSASGLGKVAGLGTVLARWEKFYLNPFPTEEELQKLARVVTIDVDRIRQMLPSQNMVTQIEPIMLCAACYREKPYHRLQWQDKNNKGCELHQLQLLSKCINCGSSFPIPALWSEGKCSNCHLPFAKMLRKQKVL